MTLFALRQTHIQHSFLGNNLGAGGSHFFVSRVMKSPRRSREYSQLLCSIFSRLPSFLSMSIPLACTPPTPQPPQHPPRKGPRCVKSKNWVNTSKLCSHESTAMHTKPQEVCAREGEMLGGRLGGGSESEVEWAQLRIQSCSKLTSGPARRFSWKPTAESQFESASSRYTLEVGQQ